MGKIEKEMNEKIGQKKKKKKKKQFCQIVKHRLTLYKFVNETLVVNIGSFVGLLVDKS